MWNSVWEKLNLKFLHLLGTGPTNEVQLSEQLHAFLTLVTAAFGLRFNRAILLTLNEDANALDARAGVGHLEQDKWEASCKADKAKHSDEFETWVASANEWDPTPVEEWVSQLRPFSLNSPETEIFSKHERAPAILEQDDIARAVLNTAADDLDTLDAIAGRSGTRPQVASSRP